MASLSFILGIIGNIISMLVFTSPIGTFRRVVKKKSTENYKGIPYITTLLSTCLWTFYGLLKPDGLLIVTVNGAGAILQFIYVTLFLIYAPKDIKVKSMKVVGIVNIGFFGAVVAVTLLAFHGSLRLTLVGVICAVLTIGMYAAPLSAMRRVVKTKSVEFMPFFLSFFLFLNGGIWAGYAVLVKDFFIGVPNAVGFLLGSAQLIIYAMYKDSTKSMEEMEEEGSAHLKGAVEMRLYEDDADAATDAVKIANHNLAKGRSLPTVSRQHSFQKILKTFSLSPYELRSSRHNKDDIEHGVRV